MQASSHEARGHDVVEPWACVARENEKRLGGQVGQFRVKPRDVGARRAEHRRGLVRDRPHPQGSDGGRERHDRSVEAITADVVEKPLAPVDADSDVATRLEFAEAAQRLRQSAGE